MQLKLFETLCAAPGYYPSDALIAQGISALHRILKEEDLHLTIEEKKEKNHNGIEVVFPRLKVEKRSRTVFLTLLESLGFHPQPNFIQALLDQLFEPNTKVKSDVLKLGIDREKLNGDCAVLLSSLSSTVQQTITAQDLLDYKKFLDTKKAFESLVANSDTIQAFKVLDRPEQRLRNIIPEPQRAFGNTYQEFMFSSVGVGQLRRTDLQALEVSDGTLSTPHGLQYQMGGGIARLLKPGTSEYDSGIMIEEDHVLNIVRYYLMKDGTPGCVFSLPTQTDAHIKKAALAVEKDGLINLARGNPVSFLVSNNAHWITVTLLPKVEADGSVKDIVAIGMDSMNSCNLATQLMRDLKKMGKGIGLNISDLHDMSINGQQIGLCCGVATALNTVSMLKTFHEHGLAFTGDRKFDAVSFKRHLKEKVFYGKDENDQEIGTIPLANFHARVGRLLYELATPEAKLLHGATFLTVQDSALNNMLNDDRMKKILARVLQREFSRGKKPRMREFEEHKALLKEHKVIDDGLGKKLEEVIGMAKDDTINLNCWDAFLFFLYNLPIIWRILNWFDVNVANAYRVSDKLEQTIEFEIES